MINENLAFRRRNVDVCGNRLIFICNTTSPVSSLSHLCWNGARRVADGVARLEERDGHVEFSFANPDGTADVCGNALLAVCKILDVPSVRVKAERMDMIAASHHNRYSINARLPNTCRLVAYGDYVGLLLEVGTPHWVVECADLRTFPLLDYGSHVTRDLDANLTICSVATPENIRHARTFERGVEAETLACGTGAMAVSIAFGPAGTHWISYPGGWYSVDVRRVGSHIDLTVSVDEASVVITP